MLRRTARRHRRREGRSAEAMACIEARGLRKTYNTTTALDAILGLTSYEGELRVLGRDPWSARDELMRDVSFIADVAVLPRWIRVSQLIDYVAGVHPRFDRAKAER